MSLRWWLDRRTKPDSERRPRLHSVKHDLDAGGDRFQRSAKPYPLASPTVSTDSLDEYLVEKIGYHVHLRGFRPSNDEGHDVCLFIRRKRLAHSDVSEPDIGAVVTEGRKLD